MVIITMNYSDSADEPADDCGPANSIDNVGCRNHHPQVVRSSWRRGRRYDSGLIQAEGISRSPCIGATINSFNTRMWIVHLLLCDSLQRLWPSLTGLLYLLFIPFEERDGHRGEVIRVEFLSAECTTYVWTSFFFISIEILKRQKIGSWPCRQQICVLWIFYYIFLKGTALSIKFIRSYPLLWDLFY